MPPLQCRRDPTAPIDGDPPSPTRVRDAPAMPRRLAVSFSIVALAAIGLRADDDLARELPRIPPTGPAEASKTFRIHEGFRLEPVAVEPIVTDPVSACYDADGRLYVV